VEGAPQQALGVQNTNTACAFELATPWYVCLNNEAKKGKQQARVTTVNNNHQPDAKSLAIVAGYAELLWNYYLFR
jgi:hypothetical protein